MGFFSAIGNAISNVFDFFFGGGDDDGSLPEQDELDTSEFDRAVADYHTALDSARSELEGMATEIDPFGEIADERYYALLDSNFGNVPAIELYNGEYAGAASAIKDQADTEMSEHEQEVENYEQEVEANVFYGNETGQSEINQDQIDSWAAEIDEWTQEIEDKKSGYTEDMATTSTEIQTFLREPTSDLEAAELWDAKNVKAVIDHIPPHGTQLPADSVMSDVMRAYRMFEETNAYQLAGFGSQEAINAMYEAYVEGQDPYGYISRIINLQAIDGDEGKNLNEYSDVLVPYADTGSGFGWLF